VKSFTNVEKASEQAAWGRNRHRKLMLLLVKNSKHWWLAKIRLHALTCTRMHGCKHTHTSCSEIVMLDCQF